MKALILDVETTGLGARDEPINIGLLLCNVDQKQGRALSTPETYEGLRHPSVSIHPAASCIHGLTADNLTGMDFDHAKVKAIIQQADIVISHNASFDARMLLPLYPELKEKSWRCSWRQWPWSSKTERKRLSDAVEICGIPTTVAHRAMQDALTLWQCLQTCTGKTERSKTYLQKLISKPEFSLDVYIHHDIEQVRKIAHGKSIVGRFYFSVGNFFGELLNGFWLTAKLMVKVIVLVVLGGMLLSWSFIK